MMYANSLLIVQARNYTESVLHICLFQGDSGLTYSKSILVNRCKCTVQLTADTGRELSTPLVSIHALECIPLQKLSVVQTYCCSLMEAIFGTFTVSMPVKPTDLGILQLKFAGICHSLYIHIL